MQWSDLNFWNSEEWKVCVERLEELTDKNIAWCPGRKNLFRILDILEPVDVRVMFVGQDPYPNPDLATGIAFSVPSEVKVLPPTLKNIFDELTADLHIPSPSDGNLIPWVNEGVLLWNAYPTCVAWESMSHRWPEWASLTHEIIRNLACNNTVFVALGSEAAKFLDQVDVRENRVLITSHPSPRANRFSKRPFSGSRIFSRVNAALCELKRDPVDWRLT